MVGAVSVLNDWPLLSVCVCSQTALHWAAKQGSVEGVDMMARTGVDVNIKSVSGRRGDRWCRAVKGQ